MSADSNQEAKRRVSPNNVECFNNLSPIGAMIYVVVEELIPESQLESITDVATIGAMLGFVTMMTLDVALG